MQFNIDMTKAVKIVVKKDDESFIEYTINDGTITDVSIIKKEPTIEEKINNLKDNNLQVKRITKLLKLTDRGLLQKMAEKGYDSIADVIKDEIRNNPLDANQAIEEAREEEREQLENRVKDSVNLMKMDDELDAIAMKNHFKIADNLLKDNSDEYKGEVMAKGNLEVPDDLENDEPKEGYEAIKAKNSVNESKTFESYVKPVLETKEELSKNLHYDYDQYKSDISKLSHAMNDSLEIMKLDDKMDEFIKRKLEEENKK